MNKDTVIGIVGAAVLVAAMVGVFFYERNVAAASGIGAADAAASMEPLVGPTLEGTVSVGTVASSIAEINATSAGNVTFRLTWSATNGQDTLKLTVAPPTGSGILEGGMSEPSDTGEITVTVAVPPGASPAGGWKVEVEFVEANPAPLPGGIPPPTAPPGSTDSSVDYSVAITLS